MAYTESHAVTASSAESRLIGAVDVGGTKVGVAAVTEAGCIATRAEWPTASLPPQEAVQRMAAALRHCCQDAGGPLRGVGIGCTGPVDPLTGTVGEVDLLPGWAGFPLARELARHVGVPIAVENDADAAALAEARWGSGQGASRFIYLTVSTGIGAGLVFDGRIYRGMGGAHPEVGHHVLEPTGPPCYCGARGCWESLASGPAMVRWVRANAGDRPLPPDLSASAVCDWARQGDPLATRAVERLAGHLGIGLANLVTMLCPDVIALGGGVMRSAELFLDRARHLVRTRCGMVPADRVTITLAALGSEAPLLGAARVWLARFEEGENERSATGTDRH